jgi:hypothetical protein
MKMPWHNKTGIAQVATFLAVLFLVSTGLCGLNLAAYGLANRRGFGFLPALLMATGPVEIVVMVVSAIGLIACGIAFLVRAIARTVDKSEPEE